MKPAKEVKKESVKVTLNKRLEGHARNMIAPAGRSLSEYIEDLIAQDLRRAGVDPYSLAEGEAAYGGQLRSEEGGGQSAPGTVPVPANPTIQGGASADTGQSLKYPKPKRGAKAS